MTHSEINQAIQSLNNMVLEGRLMDAFEQFYHDDVQMQENCLPPTISKAANRQRELEFLANVTEFRHAEVKAAVVGEDISYVIWHYDYTHKEWGVKNYTQVSVQRWRDGKIIHEQFIY